MEVWSGRASMFVKAQIGRVVANASRVGVDWRVADHPMERRELPNMNVTRMRWRRLPEELQEDTPVPCSYCGLDAKPRTGWEHTCSMKWCNNWMHSQSGACGQKHAVYVHPQIGYCCPAHIPDDRASQAAKDAIAKSRAEAAEAAQQPQDSEPSEKALGKRRRANYAEKYGAASSSNPEAAGVRLMLACVRPCCRTFVHAHAQRW